MKPYKGYTAEYSFGDGVFYGEVTAIKDVVTFQACDLSGLEHEFHASVDDYLDWCATDGVEPEKPKSL